MRLSPELKIGIMVTVALTILGVLIIATGGKYFFQRGYTIKVYFDYVSGLDVGAPVRLAGMEVGEVQTLDLVGEKIEVTLKLKPLAKVRSDSRVTINSLGIVGEKYIEITLGTPQGRIIPQGGVIYGVNPINVEEMLVRTEAVVHKSEKIIGILDKLLGAEETWREFDKIIKNTATFTATLNELLLENKNDINDTINDINATIKELHTIATSLRKIINENRDDFRITTEKFKESAIQLNKTLANLDNTITGTKEGISTIIAELNETLESIHTIIQKIQQGKGTMGKLVSDREIGDRLANAAKNIEELTLDLKKHPWKLIRKN